MNPFVRLSLVVGGACMLCQCGMMHSIDRSNAQAWNEGLVWKPRPGSTKDFVPMDFNGPPLAGSGKGEWVTDPQDGYRFYVPAAGTKKFPAGILRAEAAKATNDLTGGQQTAHNTVRTALFPVFGVAALFDSDTWHNPGGGGGGSSSLPDTTDNSSSSSSSGNCHDHSGHDGGGKCDSGGGSHGK